MQILVTGSSGFIGQKLTPQLRKSGHAIISWPRTDDFDLAANAADEVPASWIELLEGSDTVAHLAGLAHQTQSHRNDEQYFRINRDGTLRLAAAAHAAGVKRFIFLSSAKVFGEGGDVTYCDSTEPAPQDAYAQSKWQAEQLLMEQFSDRMDIIILRPPLVYGNNAKANFGALMRLARLPLPLPLAGIDNRRALIGIDNLIDLIERCLTHPNAANKTLLCADAELYSLPSIVTAIRRADNRRANLFHLPQPLLKLVAMLLGKARSSRLLGDFRMDCSTTYELLDWQPPFTMEQILRNHPRTDIT
ncbi:MAG TPA: NAD-dependent epimerase/dehydratase family protein [Spongiibacteraceae bacterium]|nr:NAD-dependent epimerase/dehydratase family protein [Spongiibacteraceae bacterium]